MTDPTYTHRNLVAAMLNAAPNREGAKQAYHYDAEFHAVVDGLALAWMDLVKHLINAARDRSDDLRRRVHDLQTLDLSALDPRLDAEGGS